VETYQLWIVDKTRDEKTPVSGGVFDMNALGEVIIPIDAQLKINEPKVFAVTKEKAGGVVVSKPDRIVAVAKV
jgi:anti-sigma-K factor RskA